MRVWVSTIKKRGINMERYALVIDSTVYLSEEEISKYDITRVSLNIIDGEETFKELDVDKEFVYSRLDKGQILTTSQPSPGEFLLAYEKIFEEGYEKIFVVCLSDQISGTYQSATLARDMMDDPDKVYVFNAGLAAFGSEMISLKVIDMIRNKKEENEIIERINKLINSSNLIFTLETLQSLIRSGRLSKAKAVIGTVLRIKPLIQMVEGKLDFFKSARTHKKVTEEIIARMKETTKGYKSLYVRILGHNSTEQATALKNELEKVFKNIKITYTENLGPIFNLHLGKRGYGLSWCYE